MKSMWIAGGEWLANNLNAIAAFMRGPDGTTKNCALHCSFLRGGRDVGTAAQRDGSAGWVAVFPATRLLANTSVQIIDNSDLAKVRWIRAG